MGTERLIIFDPFCLDLANECLWRGSEAIKLRPKAFAVLNHLIERPAQLVSKLTYLAAGLAGHDAAPTAAEKEVHALLKQRLAAARARLDEVLGKDVAAFNSLLKERGMDGLPTRLSAPAEPD